MAHRARVRLVLRVVLATAWAAAMALAGLQALLLPVRTGSIILPGWVWVCGGCWLLAAAQLVFASLVGDRLFPHANPWVAGSVELVACLVMVVGMVALTVGGLA